MMSESVRKGPLSPDVGSLSGPATRGQASAGSPPLQPHGISQPNKGMEPTR